MKENSNFDILQAKVLLSFKKKFEIYVVMRIENK